MIVCIVLGVLRCLLYTPPFFADITNAVFFPPPESLAGINMSIMIIWVPVTFQRCIKTKVNIDMISNLTGTLLQKIWILSLVCCIQLLSGLSNHSSLHSIKPKQSIKRITNLYIILPKIALVAARPIIAPAAAQSHRAAGTANKSGYKKITNLSIIPLIRNNKPLFLVFWFFKTF